MWTQKKTGIAAAGASLALAAAVVGASVALPSDNAWAATTTAGIEQTQQDASPVPAEKPGRQGERRGGNQQQRGEMQAAYQDALAARLGVSTDQLKEAMKQARVDVVNKAVTDGKITQEQADRMIQGIENGRGPGQPGMGARGPRGKNGQHGPRQGGPGGLAGMRQGGPQAMADALGMTPEDLRTEMQAGKTLAQVAEAKGVSRDDLKAKLLEAQKTRIDAAVAEGKLTAEQAQKMTERATTRIDAMLDKTPGQRPGPRGSRTGN